MHLSLHSKLKMKSATIIPNYLLKNIFILVYMICIMFGGKKNMKEVKIRQGDNQKIFILN